MGKLVRWRGGWRSGVGALLVVALTVAGSLIYGDRGRKVRVPGASPQEIARLLESDRGSIVVDTRGRPVRGPDGKPLRVDADDRTLLDSRGRPLRDSRGRALRIGADRRLPSAARRSERPSRRPTRRPARRRGKPPRPERRHRPARRPAAGAPVTVGLTWIDPQWLRNAYRPYNADPGAVDPTPAAQAVANRVNATGGIGGHPVQLRTREVVPGNDYDAAFQAACQHFLSGPRPLAVINGPTRVDQVGGCVGRAGITLIADPAVGPSRNWMAGLGVRSVLPAAPAIDRIQESFLAALVDAGFLAGDAKLGLIWQARDDHRAGAAAFKAAMRTRRLRVADEHELPTSTGLQDVARVAAGMASVMVRFRSRGIDRVVVIDHAGETTGLIMRAAEAQRFRPRWGITSANGPHQLARHIPREQLRDAIGIGWHPSIDVLAIHEGSRTDTYHECSRIFRSAEAPAGERAIFGEGVSYAACDALLLLQTALRGRQVSSESFGSAIDGLGTGFSSALGFATRLGSGRRDGMDGYRRLRYDAKGCGCFRYY